MSQVTRPIKTVFLVSLGCAKNRVDSEHLLGYLLKAGYCVAAEPQEADAAIVNTCGFVEPAVEESIDVILEMVRLKEKGRLKRLLVAGCLVQRYGYKLRRELPEVDGWLGVGEMNLVVDVLEESPGGSVPFKIGRPNYLPDHREPRVLTTPFYSAYVRIAEGCSHGCAFCTIPRLRGRYRSRTPESILAEVAGMAEQGVKEFNLVAQDTTMYGKDLGGDIGLESLLERIAAVKGVQWVRLLYSHPARITDNLLDLMRGHEVICPYIDMPLQHVNEEILRYMKRYNEGESPYQLVERIRARVPGATLRTTFMVGFPGEDESAFKELYDFVNRAEFDHLGVFAFSPEKGTPAARMGCTVEGEIARERLKTLMELQAEISRRKNSGLIGSVVPVLLEGESPETKLLLSGRTQGMAPEVDGQVLINKGTGTVGDILPVLISEAHAYDLIGEIVDSDFKRRRVSLP